MFRLILLQMQNSVSGTVSQTFILS